MGLYYDVSTNKWTFFDEYDPEPEGTIDTTDSSFSLATVKAGTFEGNLTGNVTGAVTGNVSGNVTGSLTGNVTGNVTGDVTGNADTATALETARTISLTGDVTGSATFDGSANASITAVVQDDSHSHVISNVDGLQAALDGKADDSTTITAGNGLTGGGSLGSNRTLNVGAGGGITVSADAVAHADTSSQASVNNSGNTFIQDVTLDTYGHVTGLTSSTVTVGDATITVATGGGLTGSGDFTTNQGTNETITLSHADTSSQASVNNSGRTYIQDITLDAYGHITGITSATETVVNTNQLTTFAVEDGDSTQVVMDHGSNWKFVEGGGININWTDTNGGYSWTDPYDLTFTINTGVTAGSGLTGGGILNVNRTISHADTSSQASVNNSGGTVIQDVTLDTFGHVTSLNSVNLDARYVNKTGDTMTGNLTIDQGTAGDAILKLRSDTDNDDEADHPSLELLQDGDVVGYRLGIGATNTDTSLADSGNGFTITNTTSNGFSSFWWSPNNGGNAYRVFHDNYHPNADKWTTARTHTVTLTGEVTGTASQTVDGSGNKTWSLATTLNHSALNDQYVNKTGDTMTGDLTISSTSPEIKLVDTNSFTDANDRMIFRAGGNNLLWQWYDNSASSTSTLMTLNSVGQLTLGSNSVFHDGYHPNADKWTTARTLSLSGDASGSVSWDGSGNATLSVTVANDSHSHSNYLPKSGGTMTGTLTMGANNISMSNSNITGVNSITINDPGEGIIFSGTNNVTLYAIDDANDNIMNFSSAAELRRNNNKVWDAGNDGSGSGLDADLLDGVQGSSYLRSNVTDAFTGSDLQIGTSSKVSFGSQTRQMLDLWSTSYGIGVQSNTTYFRSASRFSWHRGGSHSNTENAAGTGGTVAMTLDSSSNLHLTGDYYAPNKIIHTGDTDTYLQFHGANLFRVVIAGAEVQEWGANYTLLSDNDTLRLGTGSDFRMWHDGTNTYFRNYNHSVGSIYFQGEDAEGTNHGLIYMECGNSNPYVRLFQNGSERLRTLSGGVGVTGLTVGDVDANPHNSGGLQVKPSGDEKIVLSGSSNPYIRWQEGTADKAYIQWQDNGQLLFRNQETGSFVFRPNSSTASVYLRFEASDGDVYGGVYGTHNNEVGFLDDDSQWAYRIATDSLHEWRINNTIEMSLSSSTLDMKGNTITEVEDIGLRDRIYHDGDTNCYIQFHATDQWRVVTGGAERLEVNNSQITSTEPIHAPSFHGSGANLTGIVASARNGYFWENNQTITSNQTITNNKNAMSAGPITVNSGVTVTIGDGEAWTVV